MEIKIIIKYGVIILFLLLCIGLVVQMTQFYDNKEQVSEVPDIELMDFNTGNSVNIKSLIKEGAPCMFIFFHPECDVCVMETSQLISNQSEIEDVVKVFITTAKDDVIKSFVSNFQVLEMSNSYILIDENYKFGTKYNIQAPPVTIFYDKSGMLIKKVVGFTKFDIIRGMYN